MAGIIDQRLAELGIELPAAAAPVANYVPYLVTGHLVYISGQVTMWDGELQVAGRLGDGLGIEDGQRAARICGLNLLAQLKAAAGGSLDRVASAVRLTGYVNAAADFTDHALVINGASDLLVEVFGDKAKHTRAAIGCASLPLGTAVEVDGIFQLS